MTSSSRLAAIAIALLVATSASAQTPSPDIGELSLQELLNVETISTASKFPQQVTQAPASITVVTAEEIRRYGHRTLSDVLRGVRGLYVSYGRNYSYLGVRGFGRPGDYNTRILVLIDGHRLNDPIYDLGPIGTDLPLDIETIDRVEIIRGPGSALYGTNAFFVVINVITRTGRQQQGIYAEAEAGSLRAYRGRASAGHLFANGAESIVSGSLQDINGASELSYPEFDAPETSHGIVREADGDEVGRLFGALSFGGLTVRALYAERRKQIPTASFDTVFGSGGFHTHDQYAIADVSYTGAFGRGWTGTARDAYDGYHYHGSYPYQYGTGVETLLDVGTSDWTTGELTVSRRVHAQHFLTLGVEGRYAFRQEQYEADVFGTTLFDSRRSGTWGGYIQDEWSLTSALALSGGLRVDHAGTWGTEVTPGGAVVYSPRTGTSLKLMHGRAFRAPNLYELYYYASNVGLASLDLTPETIRTSEAAWDQYYGGRVRSTVSVFHFDIADLISQTASADDATQRLFANVAGAHSAGLESEIEARWPGGLVTRVSHAVTRTRESGSTGTLTNSPRHLAKAAAIVPVAGTGVFLGLESAYTAGRRSVHESDLDAFFVQCFRF